MIKENNSFKPTNEKPVNKQSKGFEKNFTNTMNNYSVNLKETDALLDEAEQSLKKKIFSLAKMEALVFSDPRLSTVYDQMSENGEEKYGYHYNETIMNMLFNDYVLNSPKYLQKYKQAIPKEKKRRDKSGINQLKHAGEKKMAQSGLPKNKTDVEETTGAAGSSGAFVAPLNYEKKVDETTTASSAGGAAGYVGYAGPAAWSNKGDLLGKKGEPMRKPIFPGGTVIQESEYLIDPTGFAKYIELLNEEQNIKDVVFSDVNENRNNDNNKIINKTSAFNSNTVKNWDNEDTKIEMNTLNTGKMDTPNLETESKNVDEVAKSKAQQRLFGMAHAVQKGELSPDKVGGAVKKIANTVKPEDVEDFASTKHKKLPEKVDEDTQTMIQSNGTSMSNKSTPTGDQSNGMQNGMSTNETTMFENESALLESLNNELEAYSIHHNKLIKMSEDRKPSALVLRDRVGSENEKNFKKDFSDSDTKKIIDVEKELQWKDQQTDVANKAQKLGDDIEKKELSVTKGEALENVGNSDNDKGNEIPKRNFTDEEQHEVDMYRLGQQDLVYDNEPSKRFEDRMKADMGDKLYQQRQEKLEFRGKAPMYNKDTQPTESGDKKVQFNKEKSGWNEREGLAETMITGRYLDALGKRKLIDFKLNEVNINLTNADNLFELDFTGLGNTYNSKTINKQVIVNEGVINVMSNHKFYTDGTKIFAMKNPVQNLVESDNKNGKKVVNEQFSKMQHLLGYKPNDFVNTNNIKKNRGF